MPRERAHSVHAFGSPTDMNNEHSTPADLKTLAHRVLSRLPKCSGATVPKEHDSARRLCDDAQGHREAGFDATAGDIAAVKLTNTIVGDVWLIADAENLADHPDIIRAGLPVFFFDEVEQLRGKTAAELRAIGMVKAVFPTSLVLQ